MSLTNRHPAAGPVMRVLVACVPTLESRAALRYVTAHLTEAEVIPTGDAPGSIADAALVCDDVAVAERLEAERIPVVFVSSNPYDLPDGHWPTSHIRCVHTPGWLPAQRTPDAHAVGTIAPPRTSRTRATRGAVVQLAATQADIAPATAAGLLRDTLGAVRDAGTSVHAVVLDAPPQAREEILAAAGREAGPLPPVYADGDAATEQLLAEASALVSSPLLAAVNQAHAAHAPLLLLPPLDETQERLTAGLGGIDGLTTLDRRDVGGAVACAVDSADRLWKDVESSLQAARDARRGAQRIARQLRQLVLAPI